MRRSSRRRNGRAAARHGRRRRTGLGRSGWRSCLRAQAGLHAGRGSRRCRRLRRCARRCRQSGFRGRTWRRRPGRGRLLRYRRHVRGGARSGRRLTLRHWRALGLRTRSRRLGTRLRRGHRGRLRPRNSRAGLHLRRARSLGGARRDGPLGTALARLPTRRTVLLLWPLAWSPSRLLVAGCGGLGQPVSGFGKGLPGLRNDEGRQDGPDQQPAFRAHCNSRCSFQRAGIRPVRA